MNVTTVTLVDADGVELVLGGSGAASGYGFTLTRSNLNPAGRILNLGDFPLVQGGRVAPGRLTVRDIELEGVIVAPTAEEARALYQDLLRVTRDRGSDVVRVRFNNGDADVEVAAYLNGAVAAEALGGPFLSYALTLSAPDPVAYSTTQASVAFSGATNCDNPGSATVFPVLTIATSSSDVIISTGTGRSLILNGLPSTGTLVVDPRPGRESIKLNGAPVMDKLAAGSRWPEIPPGGTTLAVNDGSGTAVYRAGWLA